MSLKAARARKPSLRARTTYGSFSWRSSQRLEDTERGAWTRAFNMSSLRDPRCRPRPSSARRLILSDLRQPLFPVVRPAVEVHERENDDFRFHLSIDYSIGKSAEPITTSAAAER